MLAGILKSGVWPRMSDHQADYPIPRSKLQSAGKESV
jgi:hypothetical protein